MTGDEIADDQGEDAVRLAAAIREARRYAGLSQADIAGALEIPRAAVSAIETGRRRVTGLELKQLARLLGVSTDYLLGREGAEDPTVTMLFRTAQNLSQDDKEQVLRFAEFLRNSGRAPSVDEG